MNHFLLFGMIVVNLALAGYTVAFISIIKAKTISSLFIGSLLTGLFFDIAATLLMIAGSSNGLVTIHGLIGYSALLFMLYEAYSTLHFKFKKQTNEVFGMKRIRIFSLSFFYWIAAYITGALIVMHKHHS